MYDDIIKKWSKIYGIDKKLIRAIIQTESSWEVYAFRREPDFWKRYLVNIKNLFYLTPENDDHWLSSHYIGSSSYGLMQLMRTTAIEMGFRYKFPFELFDPATNIKWGCTLLKKLYNRYGSWDDAVSAYNQGDNRKNLDGTYKNQGYVNKVKKYMREG